MKTWQQKFNNGKPPQVKHIEKAFGGYPAGTAMYISTPAEIDQFIHQIPQGKTVSVADMRQQLATQNRAEFTCALTTGIFLRIVSELAFEQYQQGKRKQAETTPFWRVVEPSSKLADKLTFDKSFIEQMRESEG